MRSGWRALQERDAAVEKWLREGVIWRLRCHAVRSGQRDSRTTCRSIEEAA